MKHTKSLRWKPRKQPIYDTEGYPSHTSDIIFGLYVHVAEVVNPNREIDNQTKIRLIASARSALNVCLN